MESVFRSRRSHQPTTTRKVGLHYSLYEISHLQNALPFQIRPSRFKTHRIGNGSPFRFSASIWFRIFHSRRNRPYSSDIHIKSGRRPSVRNSQYCRQTGQKILIHVDFPRPGPRGNGRSVDKTQCDRRSLGIALKLSFSAFLYALPWKDTGKHGVKQRNCKPWL